MSKENFPDRDSKSILQATLCFLVKDEKVLLAMKKRGFAKGKWNGSGGKRLEGELIEDTAKRETAEEIGVEVVKMEKHALLHFYFPTDTEKYLWNQDVHAFIVTEWKGEPCESEEMNPKWFKAKSIPYQKMWEDDNLWLPKVLKGEKVIGYFSFDDSEKMTDYFIEEVDNLD